MGRSPNEKAQRHGIFISLIATDIVLLHGYAHETPGHAPEFVPGGNWVCPIFSEDGTSYKVELSAQVVTP